MERVIFLDVGRWRVHWFAFDMRIERKIYSTGRELPMFTMVLLEIEKQSIVLLTSGKP